MIAEKELKRIKNHSEKIKQESEKIKKEIRKKTTQYLLTAFGLVTALAWNELIQSVIKYLFPFPKSNLLSKAIYALFLTIFLVLISLYLEKKEE